MDNLQSLTQKVNDFLSEKAIFYLANDPERALGLEHILDSYNIACIDTINYKELLPRERIGFFSLSEARPGEDSVYRSSLKLIRSKEFLEFYAARKKKNNFIQTFKISPAFAKAVADLGAESLNTAAYLNRMFENKLSQYSELAKAARFPKTIVTTLAATDYQQLKKELGEKFVIQFNRGHTGSGTVFINGEEEFKNIQLHYPRRQVKISEYLQANSYTLNACITESGVFMGGLSFQITGEPELAHEHGATIGNDWQYLPDINETVKKDLTEQVTSVGKIMRSKGYQGMFGVDLMVKEGKVYVIEINARQPASIPMYTKIQLQEGQVPLSLLHLAEFLGIKTDIAVDDYNGYALQPKKYAQIFLRPQKEVKVNSSVKTGIYRLQSDNSAIDWETISRKQNTIFLDEDEDKPLIFQKQAYDIGELVTTPGLLLLVPTQGRIISRGGELARIQLNQSAFSNDARVLPWLKESLLAIYKHLI